MLLPRYLLKSTTRNRVFRDRGDDRFTLVSGVQYATVTIANSAATGTATISAVDTSTAIVVPVSFNPSALAGADDRCVRLELTNATTVTATRGASPASSIVVVCAVIQFNPAAIDSIQTGTIAITGTDSSDTDSITSVSASRTAVIWQGRSSASTGDYASTYDLHMTRLTLTGATTVTAGRTTGTSGNDVTTAYAAVEFNSDYVDEVLQISINNARISVSTAGSSKYTANSHALWFYQGQSVSNVAANLQGMSCFAYNTLGLSRNVSSNFPTFNACQIVASRPICRSAYVLNPAASAAFTKAAWPIGKTLAAFGGYDLEDQSDVSVTQTSVTASVPTIVTELY